MNEGSLHWFGMKFLWQAGDNIALNLSICYKNKRVELEWRVMLDHVSFNESGGGREYLECTTEPAFGLPTVWINIPKR